MTTIQLQKQTLLLRSGAREIALDLTRAVRAQMWDKPETRPYTPRTAFEIKGVYPHAANLTVLLGNKDEGLLIPVTFQPEEDGFRVIVHAEQITEQYGLNRKLMAVDVLPEFLTSRVGEPGWFMLPSFTGMLVNFKAKAPQINRDRVYMDQREWEKCNLFNAFGMNRGAEGTLAILHSGEFFCHVTTEVNQEGINRIYPSFGLRHHPGETIKLQPKTVVYRLTSGKDAGYAGMAKMYRKYLIAEKGVSPLKERVRDNPVLAYSVRALRTKIFMALKQQPPALDGKRPVIPSTTFEEAEKILDAMHAAGLTKAIITVVGWNLGGHDGAYPTRFPVEPVLGGEEGLRKLIRKALDMGYQIIPHDNWTDIYRPAPDFDTWVPAVDEHGLVRSGGLWGGGQSLKACPLAALERYGLEFDRIKDLGFAGHYYCDAQANVLWTCHHPHHPADEEEFALAMGRMLQIPRALFGAVDCETPGAHHLPFVDEFGHMPTPETATWHLNRCPQNFRDLIDRMVPFYPIAIHGLVNYQVSWVAGYRKQPGGAKKGTLRELGCGARPSMEVVYRQGAVPDLYTDSIRDLRDAYRTAFEELPDIHVEQMDEFEELGRECTRITYGNGTRVSVNWGDAAVEGLAALSYKVERK